MDTAQILVTTGGLAAIAFILWFFFGKRTAAAIETNKAGVQEVDITVKGGYAPDRIQVKRGIPVKLNFYRDETSSCSDQVLLGDFGIARDLPAFKTTAVEFVPDKEGEFTFTCGMNMLRGKLIVS